MPTIPAGSRDDSVPGTPGELIANHKFLADYLSEWANDLRHEGGRAQPFDEIDFMLGYQRALSDLAGHLRAGDGLPGGPLHEQVGA